MAKTTGDMTDSFILRRLPEAWRPYAVLMRMDRPIGWWLLLLPAWQAILLAGRDAPLMQTAWLMALFWAGAVITRSAGCIINDLWDRDIDARVARTKNRPLASGEVTPRQAALLLGALGVLGLGILLLLPGIAIIIGFASLPLVILYPFAKRVLALPQMILALTFAWGAWLGWAAYGDTPGIGAAILYSATALWVFGYDTIYAIQDMEDDRKLGIGSSALFLGKWLKPVVRLCYAGMLIGFVWLGQSIGAGIFWYCACAIATIHLAWQIRAMDMEAPQTAGAIFRSNRDLGLVMVIGAALA